MLDVSVTGFSSFMGYIVSGSRFCAERCASAARRSEAEASPLHARVGREIDP